MICQQFSGNLHFKPLSARIERGVLYGITSMQQTAEPNLWSGRIVVLISKALLIVGCFLTIPIALIETIASFALSSIGLSFDAYVSQSDFIRKHSLRIFAYSAHSAATIITLFALGLKNPNLKYHTANALIDQSKYLGSSLITHVVGRSSIPPMDIFRESLPGLIADFSSQLQRDFHFTISSQRNAVPQFDQYLDAHPEDLEFIRNIDFMALYNDREYRQRALGFLSRFLREMGVVRENQNPYVFELNQNTAEEKAYQDRLAQGLKEAFLEIYRNRELARHLDTDTERGEDLLVIPDASIYIPLTTYSQYRELLNPIQCPARFTTSNLTQYNNRREKLNEAQAMVQNLTDEERGALETKILKGSDYPATERIQQAYLKIAELATPLYQGPLMTKVHINAAALEEEGELIETVNLFQQACQDAIREVA